MDGFGLSLVDVSQHEVTGALLSMENGVLGGGNGSSFSRKLNQMITPME